MVELKSRSNTFSADGFLLPVQPRPGPRLERLAEQLLGHLGGQEAASTFTDQAYTLDISSSIDTLPDGTALAR